MAISNERKAVYMGILIFVGVLSFFLLGSLASSPERMSFVINALDRKKATVLELTGATTATSVAISLLPGDAATPVADQLADLSQYFLIILCAIYLEKYMVTLMGFVAFRILIPLAMFILIYYVLKGSMRARNLAVKMIVIGLLLYLVIPASVLTTNMIEKTYGVTIEETLRAAEEAVNEIRGNAEDDTVITDDLPVDDEGLLEKIKNLPSDIKDTAQNVISNVTTFSAEMFVRVQTILNHLIEAVAVMIITSCVIPVLVLIIFVYIAKTVLSNLLPSAAT